MSLASVHPRRSARGLATGDSGEHASASLLGKTLPKAPTFHSPSSQLTEAGPRLHIPSLPDRSLTSPKALEELIRMSEKSLDDLANDFDKGFKGLTKTHQHPSHSNSIFTLPISIQHFAVDVDEERHNHNTSYSSSPRDIKYNHQTYHDHASDSGLGSSLASSLCEEPLSDVGRADLRRGSITSLTEDSATEDSDIETNRATGLSQHANRQIKKHIVDPILHEEDLSDFHSLIKQLPTRIAERRIQTLRDLEKTFIFLAPAKAKSPASYLRFCEFSIQCVHTTVDQISVLDQRKPADRPYNNLYFVDLVEQVRQYARIMAVTREKHAKGQALDNQDHQEGEKLKLIPGNASRPAELVRERADGKTMSIDAGRDGVPRSTSISEMDDDSKRSMARKRKCDQGKIEWRSCRECGKRFTRPCDLTKHEKTHSRPWKCPEPDCRYHTEGWPTEKECERHVNDKHSKEAKLYRCLFEPCPYTSKRESNCKQHMEKAHGWRYDRCRTKKGEKLMAVKQPGISKPMKPTLYNRASHSTSSSSHSPVEDEDDIFTPAMSPTDAQMMSASEPTSTSSSPFEPSLQLSPTDLNKTYLGDLSNDYLSPIGTHDFTMKTNLDTTQTPDFYTMPADLGDQFAFGNNAYLNFVDNFPVYQPQQTTPAWSEQNTFYQSSNAMTQMNLKDFSTTMDVPGPQDPALDEWLRNIPQQYPLQGVSPVEDFALYDEPAGASSLAQLDLPDSATQMFPTINAGDQMMMDSMQYTEQGYNGMKNGLDEDPVFGQWMNIDEEIY